jgi:hypothetical protein
MMDSCHLSYGDGVARRQSSPDTGKCSARPAGRPGDFFHVEGAFATIPCGPLPLSSNRINTEAPQYAFFKAWRNLSGPMGFQNQKQKQSQNQTLGRDQTASRWSAPHPGKRTRREDHALSHRPQMSSGRLFLDRVARQHCPSPLHRHTQNNTHPAEAQAEGDISTLRGRGHFYFALTFPRKRRRRSQGPDIITDISPEAAATRQYLCVLCLLCALRIS